MLFDNVTPLVDTLSACSIPFKFFPTSDVNAPEVGEELNALPSGVVVFAPAAGLLAKTALFAAGHSLLHVHPGRLPEYRGSTPMYYSLIAEGKLCVSAIFLAPEIDVGPVLMQREFALPSDLSSIDSSYDPFIRAVVLCDILRTKRDGSSFKPNPQATSGTTYHVIHPVLKHIALLGHTTAPNLQGSE
ncbi:MAG: formyltransferase family protein [Rhodospirillales bacterium]